MSHTRRAVLAAVPALLYLAYRAGKGEIIVIGQEHLSPGNYRPTDLDSQLGVYSLLEILQKEGRIAKTLKEDSSETYIPPPALVTDAKSANTPKQLRDLLVAHNIEGAEAFAAKTDFPTEGYFTSEFLLAAQQAQKEEGEIEMFRENYRKGPILREVLARQVTLRRSYEGLTDAHNELLDKRINVEKGNRVAIVTGKVHFAHLKKRSDITPFNTPGDFPDDANLARLEADEQARRAVTKQLESALEYMTLRGLQEISLK